MSCLARWGVEQGPQLDARELLLRSFRCTQGHDDWIETGSQARTVARLVERLGAALVGVTVLVDDAGDDVRDDLNVVGLVRSRELPPSG